MRPRLSDLPHNKCVKTFLTHTHAKLIRQEKKVKYSMLLLLVLQNYTQHCENCMFSNIHGFRCPSESLLTPQIKAVVSDIYSYSSIYSMYDYFFKLQISSVLSFVRFSRSWNQKYIFKWKDIKLKNTQTQYCSYFSILFICVRFFISNSNGISDVASNPNSHLFNYLFI